MTTNRLSILKRSLPVVLEELDWHHELHSCIMAHTVIADVFTHLGITDSFPLTVKPVVLNPALTTEFKRDPMIIDKVKNLDWAQHGYAMVKFGEDVIANGIWPAHLITIIPETFGTRAALLDLTISQVNSQGLGFQLGPVLAGVPEGFLEGQQGSEVTMNGCAVLYMASLDDISYEDTPLWKNRDKQKRIAERILARLK